MSARHPPVTIVAHDRVQLPKVAIGQEPAQESTDSLPIDFPVDPISFDDRVVFVVLVLRQFLFAKPASRQISRWASSSRSPAGLSNAPCPRFPSNVDRELRGSCIVEQRGFLVGLPGVTEETLAASRLDLTRGQDGGKKGLGCHSCQGRPLGETR